MFFKQYYLGCLSHASYLVGDTTTGRAVVVDPQRDIDQYLSDATANGLTIERVVETHFHADFLSGHLEIAAATGAAVSFGQDAAGKVEFPMEPLAHGQRLRLGDVELEVRSTPGHTPESISIVIYETADAEPYGVITGDTLFIGDVGRPDLLSSAGLTAADLAARLYDSIHTQLMTLPDATRVFPAHGAGSSCGKNLSSETTSTIGEQRRTNYALQPMSSDAFVEAVTQGQSVAPMYFAYAAKLNRSSRGLFDHARQVRRVTLEELQTLQRQGAVAVDTRDNAAFAAGHFVGSINVGIEGRYAEFVGGIMTPGTPIVLVTEPHTEVEARARLGRIGFDNVVGTLDDATQEMVDHPNFVREASRLTAAQLRERQASDIEMTLIDVRNPGEVEHGFIRGALQIPLPQLVAHLGELDQTRPTVVYCAGGYRSSVAASLLRSRGFCDVSDLLGGYGTWPGEHLDVAVAHSTT
jgi:hydroxyacylglutathione hydrolase